MALVNINGRVYYTHSLRLGKWVTSACLAKGKLAFVMAEMQAELKREQQEKRRAWKAEQRELAGAYKAARKAEREREKAWRDRIEGTDRMMRDYCAAVRKAVATYLEGLGFYQHQRNEWRRRGTMLGEATRYNGMAPLTQQEQLAERAYHGDAAALETCLLEASRLHHETVEIALLSYLPLSPGFREPNEVLMVRMAKMRYDLAPPGSSAAEKVLAERATLAWLHTEILENEVAALYERSTIDSKRAEILDRRLGRAQNRLIHAMTAIARIRRLNLPVLIQQVNLGRQSGAIQVNGG